MFRFAASELDEWLQNPIRKPLVLRGARQVGKTWLVRDLAERHKLKLIELNLERLPKLAELFSENNSSVILRNIEKISVQHAGGKDHIFLPGTALLF